MTCPYCQSDCADNAKFCPNCGAPLEPNKGPKMASPAHQVQVKCPKCNALLNVDASEQSAICPFCKNTFILQQASNGPQSTAEKMQEIGDNLQKTGNCLSGCGCLMTIFVTIPILIFLFFFIT